MKDKVIHPFLFAAYPILTLLAVNIEETKATSALRSLGLTLLITGFLALLLWLWLHDWQKAAMVLTLGILLFFSYGHVYNYLELQTNSGFSLGRHRYLLPLWAAIFGLGAWGIFRLDKNRRLINPALNWIAVMALIFPLFRLASYSWRSSKVDNLQAVQAGAAQDLSLPSNQPAPDIYYIILDAYSRDDTLKELFGYDNSHFLRRLEELGFFIARCSRSNYAQTQLSLASSLNYNYLDALGDQYVAGSTTRVGIEELIHHSAIRRGLESLGYTVVAFETGFKGTQWEDADLYLAPRAGSLETMQVLGGISNFELMLLRTSAGLVIEDGTLVLPRFFQPDFDHPDRVHRERILYVFDQLQGLPALPGPKFVFAHLVIPHPPYVFGPHGEYVAQDKEDMPGYTDQITYLNQVMVLLLQILISASSTPPVIIVQGDHGAINAPPGQRMNILNAYYLPNTDRGLLYDRITPVNSFRIVLNAYFGTQLPLLEDRSLFSIYKQPYEYTIIQDSRPGCSQSRSE